MNEKKRTVFILLPAKKTYGNLKILCQENDLTYNKIRMKKFPLIVGEMEIIKTKLITGKRCQITH